MSNTRNGKIARLPQHIREQLNRRLQDGEQGKRIVEWLNSLPEVQKVLTAEFDGHPMREQNLSEWKPGGYAEWLAQQEALKVVRQMATDAGELQEAGGALTDKMAVWLTARYVVAARKLGGKEANGETDWKLLRELCNDLVALRRGDHYAKRLRLEGERLETMRQLTKEQKEKEFKEWLKRPDVQEKVRPRATRDRVIRRVFEIVNHVMVGTPLEDFEYLDDEEPEILPDPAALI
ncbi:MAG: hypothetical protein ABSB84_15745 [Verrucomicrobiota bacterium]|jgi:hypothetical protein